MEVRKGWRFILKVGLDIFFKRIYIEDCKGERKVVLSGGVFSILVGFVYWFFFLGN